MEGVGSRVGGGPWPRGGHCMANSCGRDSRILQVDRSYDFPHSPFCMLVLELRQLAFLS